MLMKLKVELLERGIRQTRMAVELGMDPAKLSRIMNETTIPTSEERKSIANYLHVEESRIFPQGSTQPSGGEATLVGAS